MNQLESTDPNHVAIIMDGNRRWARRHGLPAHVGHERVAHSVANSAQTALDLGIQWLSLFAFSTENWRRSPEEVAFLMEPDRWLIRQEDVDLFVKQKIMVRFMGDLADPRLPSRCRDWINRVEYGTSTNSPLLTITFAFNYGGRSEILHAARALASGTATDMVNTLESHLWSRNLPDVDLMIRTSGEQRFSNFMLWRCAYAELFFTSKSWPDFEGADLVEAVTVYRRRTRTFGAEI